MSLINLIKNRRSIYHLNKSTTLKEKEITNLVQDIVKYCPTAFNSQSARVVILYNQNHQKFWQILKEKLQKIVDADSFIKTAQKIDSFAAGFATILYFEDQNTISGLQEKYSLYKDNFPIWAEQSNGMLQFAIWTALSEHNIGASLQHYTPLIEKEVITEWKLPNTWKLIAQMPIGGISSPADEKTFTPIEDRVLIF